MYPRQSLCSSLWIHRFIHDENRLDKVAAYTLGNLSSQEQKQNELADAYLRKKTLGFQGFARSFSKKSHWDRSHDLHTVSHCFLHANSITLPRMRKRAVLYIRKQRGDQHAFAWLDPTCLRLVRLGLRHLLKKRDDLLAAQDGNKSRNTFKMPE